MSEIGPAALGAQEVARHLNLGHDEVRSMLCGGEYRGWRSPGGRRWHFGAAACDRIEEPEDRAEAERVLRAAA